MYQRQGNLKLLADCMWSLDILARDSIRFVLISCQMKGFWTLVVSWSRVTNMILAAPRVQKQHGSSNCHTRQINCKKQPRKKDWTTWRYTKAIKVGELAISYCSSLGLNRNSKIFCWGLPKMAHVAINGEVVPNTQRVHVPHN